MNYPRLGTINWITISTAMGMAIGLVITIFAVGLLYKAFPQMRRPGVFFWVMLGILMVTSVGSMLLLTHLQFQNRKQAGR